MVWYIDLSIVWYWIIQYQWYNTSEHIDTIALYRYDIKSNRLSDLYIYIN